MSDGPSAAKIGHGLGTGSHSAAPLASTVGQTLAARKSCGSGRAPRDAHMFIRLDADGSAGSGRLLAGEGVLRERWWFIALWGATWRRAVAHWVGEGCQRAIRGPACLHRSYPNTLTGNVGRSRGTRALLDGMRASQETTAPIGSHGRRWSGWCLGERQWSGW
jgi:hypothetical protein